MLGENAYANTATDRQGVALNREGPAHRIHQTLCCDRCIGWILHVSQHDQELIATNPGDRVLGSAPGFESFRDFLKKQIPHRMTQRIVDVLKSVEIEKEESHFVFLPEGASQCFRHSIAKECTIRQSRQSIIVSKELHSFVGDFSIRDVAKIPDSASIPSIRID